MNNEELNKLQLEINEDKQTFVLIDKKDNKKAIFPSVKSKELFVKGILPKIFNPNVIFKKPDLNTFYETIDTISTLEDNSKVDYYNYIKDEEKMTDFIEKIKYNVAESIENDFIRKMRKRYSKDISLKKVKIKNKFNSIRDLYEKKSKIYDINILYNLWNKKDIGPIVATLIYISHVVDKIPIYDLVNTWYKIKKDIEIIYNEIKKNNINQSKPIFLQIFERLQKRGNFFCYYSAESYNFISDFYMFGKCNCACGTYLIYLLSKLYPDPNYRVAVWAYEGHVLNLLVDKNGELYQYDSTHLSPKLEKKTKNDIENNTERNFCIISSEQTIALLISFSLITYSNKKVSKISFDILKKLYGVGIDNCEKIFDQFIDMRNTEIFTYFHNINGFLFFLYSLFYNLRKDPIRDEIDKEIKENFSRSIDDFINPKKITMTEFIKIIRFFKNLVCDRDKFKN